MPRAHLGAGAPFEAPLTVTAVSVRLGISPSTLRTWERRYGLGPGDRRAGAHRRYLPADVARLTRMVELVHQGVSPADAAASVLALADPVEAPAEVAAPHCVQDLVDSSCSAGPSGLRDVLGAAIEEEGLVHTWSRLVSPALDRLRADDLGQLPGCAPSAVLQSAFLEILARIADQSPARGSALASVIVLTDVAHELAAHVVGVALRWYGVDARIVATGSIDGQTGSERFRAHIVRRPIDLAIVMGTGTSCEKFIAFIADDCETDVLLVGADAPPVVDGRVLRVRTPAACVEEALALLAPGVDLVAIGG